RTAARIVRCLRSAVPPSPVASILRTRDTLHVAHRRDRDPVERDCGARRLVPLRGQAARNRRAARRCRSPLAPASQPVLVAAGVSPAPPASAGVSFRGALRARAGEAPASTGLEHATEIIEWVVRAQRASADSALGTVVS